MPRITDYQHRETLSDLLYKLTNLKKNTATAETANVASLRSLYKNYNSQYRTLKFKQSRQAALWLANDIFPNAYSLEKIKFVNERQNEILNGFFNGEYWEQCKRREQKVHLIHPICAEREQQSITAKIKSSKCTSKNCEVLIYDLAEAGDTDTPYPGWQGSVIKIGDENYFVDNYFACLVTSFFSKIKIYKEAVSKSFETNKKISRPIVTVSKITTLAISQQEGSYRWFNNDTFLSTPANFNNDILSCYTSTKRKLLKYQIPAKSKQLWTASMLQTIIKNGRDSPRRIQADNLGEGYNTHSLIVAPNPSKGIFFNQNSFVKVILAANCDLFIAKSTHD
jgi:hypothetical protein